MSESQSNRDRRVKKMFAENPDLTQGEGPATTANGVTTYNLGRNAMGIARPTYNSWANEQGVLGDQYRTSMGDSYSQLKDKYSGAGDTAWARLQRDKIGRGYNTLASQQQAQLQNSMAQQRNALAMRGGLQSGAGERMGSAGALAQMRGLQALGANRANANLGVSLQDEQMKNQMLGQLGGVEQGIQNQNIQNRMSALQGLNAQRSNVYGEDSKAAADRKVAEMQLRAN